MAAKRYPHIEFKGLLSFLILHELSKEPLYGEQLGERIGARKGDTLTPGTIYPALKKLRMYKLVRFKQDGRKKIYKLTPSGKKELKLGYKVFGRYFLGLKKYIKSPKKAKRVKRVTRR